MKQIFLKEFFIFSIIFFLLFFGLYFFIQINDQNIIYPDTSSYIAAADSVYFHQRGHNIRPMGLAVIHGFPMIFNKETSFVITFNILINVICYLTTAFLIYKIGLHYFSKKISIIIGISVVSITSLVAYTFHMLSEHIFLLVITLAFYFLNRYFLEKRYHFLIFSLSILTFSMLIRPGAKWLAIIFVLFFLKIIYKNLKQKINWLLYGSFLLILIQCAGLKYQFGNFTISYIDAVTYYNYLGSKAICFKEGKEYRQVNNPRATYLFSLDYPRQKEVASKDFKDQLLYNTTYLGKAYLHDLYDNTTTSCTPILDCKNVLKTENFDFFKAFFSGITKWQNFIWTIITFLIAAFILFFRRTKNPFFVTLSFYIVYTFLVSGISCQQGDRFHIILFPYTFLLVFYVFLKKETKLTSIT